MIVFSLRIKSNTVTHTSSIFFLPSVDFQHQKNWQHTQLLRSTTVFTYLHFPNWDMCTFCTFLLPASWDAHLAREHWKNWGKSMNLLVNWRSIWVVSQRGAWFLRPVWEVKVSHGKTNTKRFKWKKWQRHIHMYRVTHVCTCASWAWDVRNVKGDDCLCTCATEQARKIYRWSVYTVCWLKSVVSCTNRSLEHVFFFLPYITCVTNLNANMNNSCCPNSTGCNKSKAYADI